MPKTLYMVIEHFKSGDAVPVYERFRERGRLAPEGLRYVDSWVAANLERCYQLMETDDPILLNSWIAQWEDLVHFEVHPVITSAEAAGRVGRDPKPASGEARYQLRDHRPGDIGWVIHRHGALYAREWGYNAEFEAFVARIGADFLDTLDPARERCWIAERDGDMVGCVFLVKQSTTVAKLRMLLVEPHARGLGIGQRLVNECVGFAGRAGYEKITLLTHGELEAARALYQRAGFRCVDQQTQDGFGKKGIVAETWELSLRDSPGPAGAREGSSNRRR
jgi:N-acetylglutamate synthase-like GNAT family acetyltransferase